MIDVKEELIKLKDDKYQAFSLKLTPARSTDILGVRTPNLKTLAARIALDKAEAMNYLNQGLKEPSYLEEVTLYGLIISKMPFSFEEFIYYLEIFIKKIDNWATNDMVASSVKQVDKYYKEMWEYMMNSFNKVKSNKLIEEQLEIYRVRFYFVIMLNYYVKRENEYILKMLDIIKNTNTNEYYIKMAIAWLLQVIMVKDFEIGYNFLKNNPLDDFIYRKTISKVLDSYRIPLELKAKVRTLRNK